MDLHTRLSMRLRVAAQELGATGGEYIFERPRDARHGDLASGLALRLAKPLNRAPSEIATVLAAAMVADDAVASADIAAPGFVNLTLTSAARCAVIVQALAAGAAFGGVAATGESFHLEFVSANPTGPLHIGHGRAAAHGDSLARILRHLGVNVRTEYYVNDRGLQANILGASLWLRVLERRGHSVAPWPAGIYAGDYLGAVADAFIARQPGFADAPVVLDKLPGEANECAMAVTRRVREALGDEFATVREFALHELLGGIRQQLENCRVSFDHWCSEAAMATSGAIDAALTELTTTGHIYDKDGARWFRTTTFGDEKDRVVVRSNGEQTYFAADIAYHLDKCRRNTGILYLLLGADHHGYVERLRAVLAAVGEDPQRLQFGIMQLVALSEDGERVRMSTRTGQFKTLDDIVARLSVDAVRLFFVLSKGSAELLFDVERATRQSRENPVYSMQYAHARGCSLLERWGGDVTTLAVTDPDVLADADAQAVLTELRWFGPTLQLAARERAPHHVAHWLIALAGALHAYYDKVPILSGAAAAQPSRLALVAATRQALAVGMDLLGVSAPTKM